MSPEPLINLQRRLTEAGRIRAGEKTDKGAPKRLSTWRITSPHRHLIDEAAERYGGTVKSWRSPVGDEWEVVTAANTLNVLLMPNYSLSHSYEHWAGPSKCERRCDGLIESISGQPCLCNLADFTGEECDLHTRLTVALPELTTMHGWRLESKGQNAARELAGGMELAEALAIGRAFIPAKLILTEKRGQKDGHATRWVQPVIDLGIGYNQVAQLEPGHTPVPAREQPALTVAQAVEQTNLQAEPKARSSRSAAPIGQVTDFTGSAAVSAGGAAAADTPSAGEPSGEPSLAAGSPQPPGTDGRADTEDAVTSSGGPQNGEPSPVEHNPDLIINAADRRRLFGTLRGAGLDDEQIRTLVADVTGEQSTAQMTVGQMQAVLEKAGA